MISKERFKEFSKTVEKYTMSIDTKESTETKGIIKKLVFSKMAWQESLTWFAVVQSGVIFLGLMDDVINNVNTGIKSMGYFFGIAEPFQFPINITAFIAIGFIIFLFCFGLVGYKYLRTPQTSQMISVRNSGVYLMLWDMFEEIKGEIKELKTEMKQLKKNK